jgi:hypothetical protein
LVISNLTTTLFSFQWHRTKEVNKKIFFILAKMVNVKVEDGYDYHMFGSGSNDDEAELAVYSLPPLSLGDLDENGDFILPLSCKSDSSNGMVTSPRRTSPVRKCRSRHFATVSPATTISTSYSDIDIQDSFDDYHDKNDDNDFSTPKQSPRHKAKKNSRNSSTRPTYNTSQQPHKPRSTAATIASASASEIRKELGYSVQVGKDVLCGRGQKIKVLNEHYREIIRQNYPPYVKTKDDITKREIAKRVWSHIVEENGGRFLDINGVELNKPKAVLKVMKALKYVTLARGASLRFVALHSLIVYPFHLYKQGCQETTRQADFSIYQQDSGYGEIHSSCDTHPQLDVFKAQNPTSYQPRHTTHPGQTNQEDRR